MVVQKKTNKITVLWDKLGDGSKKLSLLVAIIGSLTFLYPRVHATYKVSKDYLEFLANGIEIKKDIDNLNEYHLVLSSILRANMEKVVHNGHSKYGTRVNGKLIPIHIRKSVTGDVFVFVADGKAGVYSVQFNRDENKYSFIDFDGDHHFIEYMD